MTDRDNILPPNPRHDAAAAFHARRPGLRRPPLPQITISRARKTRIAIALSLVFAPFILFSRQFFLIAVTVGFFASASAFYLSLASIRRSAPTLFHKRLRLFIAAAGLLTFNCWSCVQCNNAWQDMDRSIVTGSTLRAVAHAVNQYRERYSEPPPLMNDLVNAGLWEERHLLLPTDPVWREPGPHRIPSFVFIPESARPTAEPNTILAYERGPWSSLEVCIFPRHFHAAVRADGTIAQLTSSELAAALHRQPTSKPRE